NISLHLDNGSNAQQWAIMEDGSGDGYTLKNRASGFVIDLPNAITEDGSALRQYYYHGSKAQTWKFEQAEHTVTYDANGGENAPLPQIKNYKAPLVLNAAMPYRPGYSFIGWSLDASATNADYAPGAAYTLDEDAALFAIWISPDFILPDSLISIGEETFAGNSFIYARLSDNTQTIERKAFANCANLAYVYIPSTVNLISNDAFEGVQDALTIFGERNSYAEQYAAEHGFLFIEDSQ
ncbi:MAG: InlB B-repeat-containing protein, partial [Clostridia bacterium]|nr:InlB B-repeat-containing protein [Clostridia bacterium]